VPVLLMMMVMIGMCRIIFFYFWFGFGSVFEKNVDLVWNEFGLARFEKRSLVRIL